MKENNSIILSVIILSWNTKDLLRKCLESVISDLCLVASDKNSNTIPTTNHQPPITNHQSPTTEIIVVDNGSTDGSIEMLREFIVHSSKFKVRLIENKENLGFSKGNNQGIKEAKGEYIMLLNSDTLVKPKALEGLVDYLEKNEEVDIIGPRLLNNDGSLQANCGKFPDLITVILMLFFEHNGNKNVRWYMKKSGYVDWLMGAAFISKKQVFEKVGGLDEKMFMYMEEVEWFYRARKAGFKTFCLTESEIIHLGMGSSKSGKTEPILNIFKGIIYFYKKHKTLPELILLLMMLKLKALLAYTYGLIKGDVYLKETYGQAIKIN